MLWFLTILFVITRITITSGLCPFVANYYWAKNEFSSVSVVGSSIINVCEIDSDTINGITYDSTKFTCINNEVYINKYIGQSCGDSPGFTTKVGPHPIDYSGDTRASYTFSCDQSSECTNYMNYAWSNQSYIKYMQSQFEGGPQLECQDYSNDNFIQIPAQMTDVCLDTSSGNSSVPDSSSIWICNSVQGVIFQEYQGSTNCVGTPKESLILSINGCATSTTGHGQGLYGKLTYCNGVNYNGGPIPTITTTQMPSNTPTRTISTKYPSNSPTLITVAPSKAPTGDTTLPTQMPSNSPTGTRPTKYPSNSPIGTTGDPTLPTQMPSNTPTGTIPTKYPSNSPTEITVAPSIAPTVKTDAPTGSPVDIGSINASGMLSYIVAMIFAAFCGIFL